jgi:hypothetical protein
MECRTKRQYRAFSYPHQNLLEASRGVELTHVSSELTWKRSTSQGIRRGTSQHQRRPGVVCINVRDRTFSLLLFNFDGSTGLRHLSISSTLAIYPRSAVACRHGAHPPRPTYIPTKCPTKYSDKFLADCFKHSNFVSFDSFAFSYSRTPIC